MKLFVVLKLSVKLPVLSFPTLIVTFVLLHPLLSVNNLAHAQVVPPLTSSGLNTQISAPVNIPGGSVQYNITGGTRPGGGENLFHSFGEFGVPTSNIANFLNDSALPTGNILSRVTGGNPSNIFGTIQTQGFRNANLFLMNPAGIVFGPNASLNVGGATHFTTTDYLKLADDVQFTALPGAQDALLSVAPVASFGFVASNSAPISVEGSTLSVEEGQTLSLVGGDITIGSSLNAPSGKIALASVASPGEVLVDTYASASNANGESFTTMGNVALLEGSTLDVSADAAGTVIIRGGEFMMASSTISADTGDANGAPVAIDINVTGGVAISTIDVPALTAKTTGSGKAGEIKISSSQVDVTAEGFNEFEFRVIDTHTTGPGNAGNVTIQTGDLTVFGDPFFAFITFIETGTNGVNVGKGGDINITGNTIQLDDTWINTGNLFSIFGSEGSGTSGNVTIQSERLDLNFSQIVTDNVFFDDNSGRGGDINITTGELSLFFGDMSTNGLEGSGGIAIMADRLFASGSTILAQTMFMPGKPITISGQVLEFTEGSKVSSTTGADGDAAPISISATERIFLEAIDEDPTGFFSNSFGTFGTLGNSGDISVTTPILDMTEGARINTTTATSGRGGNVTIDASQLIAMSGETSTLFPEPLFSLGSIQPSGIFTKTIGPNCSGRCGDAGNVTITTGSLILGDGAQINSGTSSSGKGGNINLNAADTISISGTLSDGSPAGFLSRAIGAFPDSGSGGNISLIAGDSFLLNNGATVSASSNGPANAGSIQVEAANTILLDGASITTEAAQASGGNIKLTAQDLIRLNNSTISSSVEGDATTAGGNINIDPDHIVLQNSKILAKAVQGQGGNISLIANDAVLVDPLSVLDASSALGVSGTVDIQAPIQNISGTLAPLPEDMAPVTALYGARCAAGSGGHFSTFVDSKAGSLAPTPGAFLASPLLLSPTQVDGVAHAHVAQNRPVILTASIAPLVLGHASEPTTACP